MAKCKECLGCTKYVWVEGVRFLFCDFCGKYYEIVAGKLVETIPLPLRTPKKVVIREEVVVKKKSVTKKKDLPLDKKDYRW